MAQYCISDFSTICLFAFRWLSFRCPLTDCILLQSRVGIAHELEMRLSLEEKRLLKNIHIFLFIYLFISVYLLIWLYICICIYFLFFYSFINYFCHFSTFLSRLSFWYIFRTSFYSALNRLSLKCSFFTF